MIRVVFLGTPAFAVPSLDSLAEQSDIEIPLVVTQPDRRAGRGRGVRSPAVKQAAERLSLPVMQPESLRDPSAVERLHEARPDVIVLVSYGELLRTSILELPAHGCINVHPSLLPRYRGSAPIPAAILNGDSETGVSFMRLVRRMDAGPLVRQVPVELDGSETTGTLTDALADEAARHLPGTVRDWVSGELEEHEQDESQASYSRELRKSDARVDWQASASYIERFVRAMDPWPRAWTVVAGARLSIHQVRGPVDAGPNPPPGTLSAVDGVVFVGTGREMLELATVQPEGRKPMTAADWLRGARLGPVTTFESPDATGPPIVFTR